LTYLAAALASGSTNSTLSDIEPGALGFLIVASMGVILFFLLKNMNKQFKKIGPPPEETEATSAAKEAPGAASTAVRTGDAKQDARAESAAKPK
jgi:hypothetical protein